MQAAELDTDGFDSDASRARRAIALIATSLIAIAFTGAAYLYPTLTSVASAGQPAPPPRHVDYRVTAVDFVSPTTGWILVQFLSDDFAVIHTTDGGATWTRQLTARSKGHLVYAKFFDGAVGVVAVVGTRPVLYRTSDGGHSWVARDALDASRLAISWSFVDSDHGWMLATQGAPRPPPRLYRTEDGGLDWTDLGPPVPAPDQAFQVQFSHLTTGWLSSASAGPYAYRTQDFGITWTRVALPGAKDEHPAGGQYFVAVRPTAGLGAIASIVYFPAIEGRRGVGGMVRGYPPLTVRAFDGGRPHTYVYSTVLDQVVTGPFAEEPPPNQAMLGTTDAGNSWSALDPPSRSGAIGYSDASHWWWVGDGLLAGSFDGGATWTDPRGVGVMAPRPGTLQVLDRDHAWFAAQSGKRAQLEATGDGGAHWKLTTLPLLEDRVTLGST